MSDKSSRVYRIERMLLFIVYAVSTVLMAVSSVTAPEYRVVSAAFFLLGLTATWRQFTRLRRH